LSREKSVLLRCDSCGDKMWSVRSTFNGAEIEARKNGWDMEGRGSDREHYCPKCSEDGGERP